MYFWGGFNVAICFSYSFETLNYIGWMGILALMYFAVLPICSSSTVALSIALVGWGVLVWM